MILLWFLADVNVMKYGKKGLSDSWYYVFISNCFTWNNMISADLFVSEVSNIVSCPA